MLAAVRPTQWGPAVLSAYGFVEEALTELERRTADYPDIKGRIAVYELGVWALTPEMRDHPRFQAILQRVGLQEARRR